jgi:hypothetical protein
MHAKRECLPSCDEAVLPLGKVEDERKMIRHGDSPAKLLCLSSVCDENQRKNECEGEGGFRAGA